MKYRNDFVTNSSSSSFVIAYKNNESNEKVMQAVSAAYDVFETQSGTLIKDLKGLDEFMPKNEECFNRQEYNKLKKWLEKGYAILQKNVSYDAQALTTFLQNLAEYNDEIIILHEDE